MELPLKESQPTTCALIYDAISLNLLSEKFATKRPDNVRRACFASQVHVLLYTKETDFLTSSLHLDSSDFIQK
jgi:3-methyladenine DNA glycosylase AlkD